MIIVKIEMPKGCMTCPFMEDIKSPEEFLVKCKFIGTLGSPLNYMYDRPVECPLKELKTGHWIPTYGNVKCSVCGSAKDSRNVGKATHYCDFCGAKMVEPQESEDVE